MKPPKYKFYIGSLQTDVVAKKGFYIDSDGKISSSLQYNEATDIAPLEGADALVFDYRADNDYRREAVYFYDKNKAFMQSVLLFGKYMSVIEVPEGAHYYAAKFTTANPHYAANSEKPVIYAMKEETVHYNKLSKKYERESGQQFFRQELSGNMSVFGSAYDRLISYGYEDKLLMVITKYSEESGSWYDYYKGSFNLTDCKFDKSLKKCELKVSTIDDYSTILERYEDTYDLIKLAPALTQIDLAKRAVIQIYIAGGTTVSNFLGGTYWESDVIEAEDSHEKLDNTYHFHRIKMVRELFVKHAQDESINGAYAGDSDLYGDGHTMKAFYASSKSYVGEDVYTNFYYGVGIFDDNDGSLSYRTNYLLTETFEGEMSTPPVARSAAYVLNSVSSDSIKFVNAYNTSEELNVTYNSYSLYARILCDIEQTPNGLSTYELSPEDIVSDNRSYKRCIGAEIGSSIGTISFTSKKSSEPTKYGQDDNGKYFIPDMASSPTTGQPLPICRSAWINASFWFAYGHDYFDSWEYLWRKKFTLKDAYSIADVIKALLKKVDPSVVHEGSQDYSQFLYGSRNPVGTGRFYVFLTQKTNILAGEYDQAAQKAEVTLKDVLDMLARCFRLYWFIDNGKLRIEHISYFLNGLSYSAGAQNVQLDLTRSVDVFNRKRYSYHQTEIEFNKSELASRYEFGWQDDCTDLFSNVYVDIISNYVQKDKKDEINESLCSPDIDYMLISPENFSNDGFVLICAGIDADGRYYVPIVSAGYIDEDKNRYLALVQNYYASWAWLVKHYMYDMPAEATFCSATGYKYAEGVKRCMMSTVKIPSADDPSVYGLITTEIGTGYVESMSIDLNSRVASIDLAFTPQKI